MKRPKAAHIFDNADPYDWFVEPVRSTELLLTVESFVGLTWDPACGGGNVARAFMAADLPLVGTDVVCRDPPLECWGGLQDFLLAERPVRGARNIVTNPPFFRAKGTEAFIRKALDLVDGTVAVFVDIKFLASAGRARGLWREHPPSQIWILAERPSCPPGSYLEAGNAAAGGTADWCWVVWDRLWSTGTQVGWLLGEQA